MCSVFACSRQVLRRALPSGCYHSPTYAQRHIDWGMGMAIGLAVVSLLLKSVAVGYIYRTSRRRINKSVASKLPFNQVRPLSVLIFMKHANGARGFLSGVVGFSTPQTLDHGFQDLSESWRECGVFRDSSSSDVCRWMDPLGDQFQRFVRAPSSPHVGLFELKLLSVGKCHASTQSERVPVQTILV